MSQRICIDITRVLLFFVLALQSFGVSAQQDSLERYYRYNTDIVIKKIEREHIPLDGKAAHMIPFRVDDKYGFVKNDGRQTWLIQPQYEEVFAVYPEGAIVKKGQGYGMVNDSGRWIIPPYYENLLRENGIFHGIIDGIIDTTLPEDYRGFILNQYFSAAGNLLFTEKAHDQTGFAGDDTLAWFRYGRHYTIRGISGKICRSFIPEAGRSFCGIFDNLLLFREPRGEKALYSAYDTRDKLQFQLETDDAGPVGVFRLSEHLYGIIGHDGEYYFCGADGNPKPYGAFTGMVGFFESDPAYFNQNYFALTDPDKENMGLIDREGKLILGFNYAYIGQVTDSLVFAITGDGHSVFINIIDHKVNDISSWFPYGSLEYYQTWLQHDPCFSNGLFLCKDYVRYPADSSQGGPEFYINMDSTYFYYVDTRGRIAFSLPPSCKFAGLFSEGLAPVSDQNSGLGFVDTTGQWVIPPKYELAAAGAYPFPYIVSPQFKGGLAYIKSFKGYIDSKGREYFSGKHMQDHYDFSH